MRTNPPLPLPTKCALSKLGDDIRTARLRRGISATLMAERAFITRTTLGKVEKGNPGVSMGIYATLLFILGMTSRLADLADINNDVVGQRLDYERLPKRIRRRKHHT
jgi:transcriptional regulator with XRE-family HTH domain